MATPLPSMKTSPKYIFFTDFDGTITLSDSNDHLTDNLGFGAARRRQLNQDVLLNKVVFRDAFQDMMDSVTTPYDQCIALLLKNIKLDPYFKEFFEWARGNNVPIVVLSSGMVPIIKALLVHLVGEGAVDADGGIRIVANDVATREGQSLSDEGGWKISFHDDSHFGHDKSLEIRPYAALPEGQRSTMFYAGDGVSDLSAAKETDLLFAKKGRDLVSYCEREKVPYTEFQDWSTILSTVKDIAAGKTTVQEVSAQGLERSKA